MTEKSIEDLVGEIYVSSRFSLGLVALGVGFLAATVIYSAMRLSPLELEVSIKNQQAIDLAHQIEAKQAELQQVTEAVTRIAQPLSGAATNVEGWLYVGRINSSDKWAPLSQGVRPAPDGQQTSFNCLTVVKDAPIVEGDNADLPKTANSNLPQSSFKSILFVKSGTQLNVIKTWKDKSVGGGVLVWAKVNVAPQFILDIGRGN